MTNRRLVNYFKAAYLLFFGVLFIGVGVFALWVSELSLGPRLLFFTILIMTFLSVLRFLPIELDPAHRKPDESGSKYWIIAIAIASGPVVGSLIASRASNVNEHWIVLFLFTLGAFLSALGVKIAYGASRLKTPKDPIKMM